MMKKPAIIRYMESGTKKSYYHLVFKVHTRYDRNSFITYEFKLLAEQTL